MTATLSPADLVLDAEDYRRVRPERRSRMIPVRAGRRVHVGDLVTLEFENAETLAYQVQEMLFVEGDFSPGTVAHEVDAYRRYLPGPSHLVVTFFIEAEDVATVREDLLRLTGIQHAVSLEVGGTTVPGVEIPGPDEDGPSEVTAAVHFLRFDLEPATRTAFLDPATPVRVRVDHPEYLARVDLPGPARRAASDDLEGAV